MARKYSVVRDKHFPTKQLIDNPQKGTALGAGGRARRRDAEFPTNWQAFQTDSAGDDCLSTNNRAESRPCALCTNVFFLFFIPPRIGGPTIIPVLAGENRRHPPLRLLRRECRVHRTRRVGSLIYRCARARSPLEDRPGCC